MNKKLMHLPFDHTNPFAIIVSWCFWIVCIFMILTPIIVVAFDDLKIPVTQAMRILGFWNVMLGGSFFMGRLTAIGLYQIWVKVN